MYERQNCYKKQVVLNHYLMPASKLLPTGSKFVRWRVKIPQPGETFRGFSLPIRQNMVLDAGLENLHDCGQQSAPSYPTSLNLTEKQDR
jgi:hypothetical protein